jgi:hypothetical protein
MLRCKKDWVLQHKEKKEQNLNSTKTILKEKKLKKENAQHIGIIEFQ